MGSTAIRNAGAHVRTVGVLEGQINMLCVLKRRVQRDDVLVLQLAMDLDLPLHLHTRRLYLGTWTSFPYGETPS